MPTLVISPYSVATFPEGGGHFWVYLQYVLGMRQLGYDVYWLEAFRTRSEAFSTVSNWDSSDWIVDGAETYENTKRVAFLVKGCFGSRHPRKQPGLSRTSTVITKNTAAPRGKSSRPFSTPNKP